MPRAAKSAQTARKQSNAAAKTSRHTPGVTRSKTTSTGKKTASTTVKKTTRTSAAKTTRVSKQPTKSADAPSTPLAEYNRKRDFTKTAEPAGEVSKRTGKLRFVIQKHAASHLHFDLRLELDGVMKSWAVPKGPSADPAVKRLAMQVEDHPISYNSFEGTIPEDEYGGGTVMLWDTGTYTADHAIGNDDESAVRDGYAGGDLKVTFHGKRMQGSYALVRTKGLYGSRSSKPSWLLVKHRDRYAQPAEEYDIVQENMTSVVSKRTMEQIRDGVAPRGGKGR